MLSPESFPQMMELVQQLVSGRALQSLHEATYCDLRRYRHEKVYMVSLNVALHYQNLVFAADFADKLPQP